MEDERLRHALSEREHQRIFRHEIAPLFCPEGLGHSTEPTAAILGGQPGAGRTRLLHEATTDLTAKGSTVVISGEDLRPFHPAYGRLQHTDPLSAAHDTDYDTGRWVETLIEEGRSRSVNLVIESTMRRPEVFARTAGALHDAAVAGMLRTLEAIDTDSLADHVRVTTRAGRTIYENSRENGAWQREPAAVYAPELRMAHSSGSASHVEGFSQPQIDQEAELICVTI
jgi:hypothetical protein